MATNSEHLAVFYALSKRAYEKELTTLQASREISTQTGCNTNSAADMVRDFAHMMRGEVYQRRLSFKVTEHFLDAIHRDYGTLSLRQALASLWAHIEYYEAKSKTNSVGDRELHERFSALCASPTSRSQKRLPAEILNSATPEYIWSAVQLFLAGEVEHRFGPSTDFDLIADSGQRFPPKAVFGVALSLALDGIVIEPKHFTAGESSTCFRLLRAAGYRILPKGSTVENPDWEINPDQEWDEGPWQLAPHMKRERATGLAKAKKAQFLRTHGRLFCERCKLDPVEHYGSDTAEACIEVHHARIHVSQMSNGHKTKLDDLECLCANCHRLVHREMRDGEH